MSDARQTLDSADLLYGFEAIGSFLGITPRQAKHRAAAGDMPTFKLGHHVCARRASLREWLAEEEASARAEGERQRVLRGARAE